MFSCSIPPLDALFHHVLMFSGMKLPACLGLCCVIWANWFWSQEACSVVFFRSFFSLTFLDECFNLLVEAQPVTLPPQAHVGRVMLPVAVVDGVHGEQLPPVPGRRQLLLPAPSPQRQAIVGDVDEARVLAAAGQASTSVSVPPGVSLVPVVGTHRHGQHA